MIFFQGEKYFSKWSILYKKKNEINHQNCVRALHAVLHLSAAMSGLMLILIRVCWWGECS